MTVFAGCIAKAAGTLLDAAANLISVVFEDQTARALYATRGGDGLRRLLLAGEEALPWLPGETARGHASEALGGQLVAGRRLAPVHWSLRRCATSF